MMSSFFQTALVLPATRLLLPLVALSFSLLLLSTCGREHDGNNAQPDSHEKMAALLSDAYKMTKNPGNKYASDAKIALYDSVMASTQDIAQRLNMQFLKAAALLEYGDEVQSVALYEDLLKYTTGNAEAQKRVLSELSVAYLRLGERNNCVSGHTSEACIMPVRGNGIHQDKTGSRKAIEVFESLLNENPDDPDSRWLLNIAYMTLGEYPGKVPSKWLIPGLADEGKHRVNPFPDVAADVKLSVSNCSGGSIIDDFDNDGFLDLVTSVWALNEPMRLMHNNGDGTFSDHSRESKLNTITGGLNLNSMDYNNDGRLDIFVLRGGWQGQGGFGKQPNSLLRNNGDGTFTDVTTEAGILSFHPTQAATWNDFNNDGWLDVFIGNETMQAGDMHPCELYLNNKNGTFTNVATPDVLNINAFIKAVVSGDYDNDGWPDIFISTQNGRQLLLHNMRAPGQTVLFEIASEAAGFKQGSSNTFPTGFLDYDNDGWLDIFLCDYDFERPLSYYAAKEALHPSDNMAGKMYLYRNNRNGTFTDVSKKASANAVAFAMSANFGDIDNDGFLDIYLGTGNPNYRSLVPNKLFKNLGGQKFVDVTASARVGNLQKGHGISIADIDNDGDQDIHIEMGGAFQGDVFPNALYLNPGQGNNKWIYLKLEGTKSNRAAIGAKVTVKFRENGRERMVYREVNTGASFGCSPLRREIGIGQATVIDEITITWPASGITQVLKNIQPNQFLKIMEGQQGYEQVNLKSFVIKKADGSIPMCAPVE